MYHGLKKNYRPRVIFKVLEPPLARSYVNETAGRQNKVMTAQEFDKASYLKAQPSTDVNSFHSILDSH